MLKTYYANINVKKPFNLLLHTSWSHELASYSNSTSGVTLYLPTKVHKWVIDKDLRKIYENLLKANTQLWDIGWYCKCHQPGLSVSKATWINHFSLTISNLHKYHYKYLQMTVNIVVNHQCQVNKQNIEKSWQRHCGLSCGKTSCSRISMKSKQPCQVMLWYAPIWSFVG